MIWQVSAFDLSEVPAFDLSEESAFDLSELSAFDLSEVSAFDIVNHIISNTCLVQETPKYYTTFLHKYTCM